MYDNITGIILSGGKSSRMGENKSLMKIKGKTIIEHVKLLMQSLFNEVILITNDQQEYEFLGLKMFSDIFLRMGPLAGIHSGLFNSLTQKNFIISCDIPLMTPEMIKYLVDFKTDKPVTIAKADGYLQQLCGVYDKICLPFAEEILSNKNTSEVRTTDQKKRGCTVLELINLTGAEIIQAESLPFYVKDTFFNMNKRDDFYIVKERLEHSI
jgi:molybdopterin-guanine dinucleotide biosynthesis protein A